MKTPRFKLTPQKLPKLNENQVEKACLDLLRFRGYRPERIHSGLFKTLDGRFVTMGEPGLPDYISAHAIYPAFYMEVKRPGGKPSPDQDRKILELKLGYRLTVVVIDSVDALVKFLHEHEKRGTEKR